MVLKLLGLRSSTFSLQVDTAIASRESPTAAITQLLILRLFLRRQTLALGFPNSTIYCLSLYAYLLQGSDKRRLCTNHHRQFKFKSTINNNNKEQTVIMTEACVLCYEDSHLFGITECNHGPFCYRCVYKMRVVNKNNSCPICKAKSNQIMISEEFKKFGDYKGEVLPDSNFGDVYHCGKLAKKEFEKLRDYKCFVKINGKPCKYDKSFDNTAFLKKHLKEEHKRVLCDVCLEKKTCVLEEQKLYSQAQLAKHMERGDIDDFGNIFFMHPYCGFCKTYFFDEDEFKRHMNVQHIVCNVCGSQHKYVYYKDYDSLETHYKISHYICSDLNCLAKKFIAFRNAEQLKIHRTEVHSTGNKKIDGKQLCGFNYGGVITEEIIEIKDKEGINMHDQFLSLKKSRNQAIGETDQQQDEVIDVRDFYSCSTEEEDHYHEAFVLKHKNKTENKVENQAKDGKKKKYIQKEDFQKEKPLFAKQNEEFTVEELNLIKTVHLSKLYFDDFMDKLSTLLNKDDLKKLQTFRTKHNKRQMESSEFVNSFYGLMKSVSLKTGYQIFPHYLRTVQNEDAKEQLEREYVKSLKKIPVKSKCLLSRSKTYGDLFKNLLLQIEKNIETRIRKQILSIKKPILREKERLYQLIGVVRRLKTQQTAKFKFAINFGVQLETTRMIHDKIFKMEETNIQNELSKIQNEQFIDLYTFVRFCYLAISHNQSMHLAKNKIHQNVLEDYLFERNDLEKEFGPKKEDYKTLDERVLFEKEEEERKEKKRLKDLEKKNKDMGYHAKANFSLSNKSDFPDLMAEKKPDLPQKDNFRDVVDTAKSKPATYEKKINQLFPTLGQDDAEPLSKKQSSNSEKKEKAWWEKLNEPKQPEYEEEQVAKIRKGKNKKEKWVSAKGFFGGH